MFRRPPVQWPVLSIGPRQQAPQNLQGGLLISITERDQSPPSWSTQIGTGTLLHLPFTDSVPGQAGEAQIMTPTQMEEVIVAAKTLQPGSRVHIHCHAGSSRSPAVAAALLRAAPSLRRQRDRDVLEAVLAARSRMKPNTWVLQLADRHLRSNLRREWETIQRRQESTRSP